MINYAKVQIRGTRPIIWHYFSEEALSDERKTKTGKAGNNPEEWKTTVLYDKNTRQLYILPSYVFGCLKNAAVYTKDKRGSIQKKLIAVLQVQDIPVYIKDRYLPEEDKLTRDQTDPVYLDVCGVVNPTTKGRNLRYRIACSKGWECEYTISWDDTMVADKQIKQIVIDGGTFVGLADGRSDGRGRYELIKFDIQ